MSITDTATATMQAIVRDHYGNADVLRLARVARPEATDNEAVLRVQAAGLDRGIWHMMTGKPYLGRLVSAFPGRRTRVSTSTSTASSWRSVRR